MVEICPKCASNHKTKAGLNIDKKQRYKCKKCGCHFTRSSKKGCSPEIKRRAIQLYLEGLGLRAIGRILNVSNVTILKWVNKAGIGLIEFAPQNNPKIKVIPLTSIKQWYSFKQSSIEPSLLITIHMKDSQVAIIGTYHIATRKHEDSSRKNSDKWNA